MKKKKIIVILAVIVFLVQAACAVGTTTDTPEPQAPPPTEVVADTPVPPVVPPTNPPPPVEVLPTITPEPTFTEVPIVQGSLTYGAYCRTGPGANFQSVIVYELGTLVNVIGTNKDTSGIPWWLVSSSGQTDCWLTEAAVAISGDKSSVVLVISPPTPTPVPLPSWTGVWKLWQWQGIFAGSEYEEISTITITQTGNSVSWSYNIRDARYNGRGTVSEDGMMVSGTDNDQWGNSYGVRWVRNSSNLNQFRGRWWFGSNDSLDGAFCGAMNGAPKPSPCKS